MTNVTPTNPAQAAQAAELAALKKQLADAQAALAKAGAVAATQTTSVPVDFPKNADGSYKTYRLPSTPCSYVFSNAKHVIAPEGLITPENDVQAAELHAAFIAGNIWEATAEKVSEFQKDIIPVSVAAVEQGVNTNKPL